uniref:Uncharacterized protein n=1 Tax=Ignavibacterium album TaxID=591197 RepID=A0A832D2J6_9BACT
MKIYLKIFLVILIQANFILPQSMGQIALLLPSELREPDSVIYNKMIDDITSFELFLMQSNLNYNVIYTNELNDYDIGKFDILILPSSFDFNQEDFESLNQILSKGTALLSVGNFNVIEDDQKIDLYKKLFEMECLEKNDFSLPTITQSFHSNIKEFITFESFDLLLSKKDKNIFYKTDDIRSFSFGCVNSQEEYTTSFFGYTSSGRFTHFGFSFSKILSEKSQVKKFEKLLLKTIEWLKKDSGIRISVSESSKKQFMVVIDLSKGLLNSEKIINAFKEENYPLLLVSEDINKLKKFFRIYQDNISYGINLKSVLDTDSIIQIIKNSTLKPKFLLLEDFCLNERDIKKLSFEGIENILVKNKCEKKYYPLYNILATSYDDLSSTVCSEEKIFLLDILSRINCEEDFLDKNLALIKEQSDFLIPYNREKLINDFLISSLKIDYREKKGLLEIIIQNPNDKEVKNLFLTVDKKILNQKLVYDLSINGESSSLQKDNLRDNFKVILNNLYPNSTTIIKIFFEDLI